MDFASDETKNGLIHYFIIVLLAILGFHFLGLDTQQVIASTLVLALVLGTVMFWETRLAFALIGISILFAAGVLTVSGFIEFSSLNIIVFLAGMMTVVGFLEKNAFFEFLIGKLLVLVGGGGKRVIIMLMFLAAIFAALVDEVTSILFMLSIVFFLTAKLRVNPIPFVLLTVFATNIGSSATAVGNPVGVMIALNAHLTFADFLTHATPIALVALLAGILAMYFYFRNDIEEFAEKSRKLSVEQLVESHAANKNTLLSGGIFGLVLLFLILHAHIEQLLGLEKNTMLLGTALAGAGLVLLIESKNARQLMESKVDWWTLMFFMMLFASVGALEQTGVIGIASNAFTSIIGNNALLAMATVMGLSGILSALLDNVLAVAVFLPLIENLQLTAIAGNYLWWALLFGATLFGNLTPIGSTANIVALGMLEKRGIAKIGFVQWFKAGIVIVLVTAVTAFALLYLQSF